LIKAEMELIGVTGMRQIRSETPLTFQRAVAISLFTFKSPVAISLFSPSADQTLSELDQSVSLPRMRRLLNFLSET
jgi:hypothetical protein